MHDLDVISDFIYTIVFILFVIFFKIYSKYSGMRIERETIEISDYAIKLSGFPKASKIKEELIIFLEEKIG